MKTITTEQFKNAVAEAIIETDRHAGLRGFWVEDLKFYSLLDDDSDVPGLDVYCTAATNFSNASERLGVVDEASKTLSVEDLCHIVRDMKKIF